jgi:hypothetical protein|tara:strand:+ start:466 stop:765 length:300 start_codon:yes stop_codon:yes gene_type:complete
MWKQILTKINASLLANWSQLVWFVLGSLLGVFFLGGFVSCQAIEATKGGLTSIDDTVRDVPYVGAVYVIPSNAVQGVYGVVEGVVTDTIDLVTPNDVEE